jgi:hypothetical protein
MAALPLLRQLGYAQIFNRESRGIHCYRSLFFGKKGQEWGKAYGTQGVFAVAEF